MVLAGAAGASILLPQPPQKRLSVGTSAPQFGQSLPDMFVLTSARRSPPARALSTVRRASQAGRSRSGELFDRFPDRFPANLRQFFSGVATAERIRKCG